MKKPAKTEKEPAVIETPEPCRTGSGRDTLFFRRIFKKLLRARQKMMIIRNLIIPAKKKPSSPAEETKTYTVTFQTASGDVFCTQTVEDGKTASKPKLQPSASGSWNYDFTKAVTENIIIKWSAQ